MLALMLSGTEQSTAAEREKSLALILFLIFILTHVILMVTQEDG